MEKSVYFISGIDTDAGKTFVTGMLARELMERGKNVTTMKFAQTGCKGISEDILKHREIMGIGPTEEDKQGLTCPYVFTVPCSPHLAAEIDGSFIDTEKIEQCINEVTKRYDIVLLEGAGGLGVPITRELLTIDWLEKSGLPLIFVSTPKLGSINHTLTSLELIEKRGIKLHTLAYNFYADTLPEIEADTERVIRDYLKKHFPEAKFIKNPEFKKA